jgi:hypothetical protein
MNHTSEDSSREHNQKNALGERRRKHEFNTTYRNTHKIKVPSHTLKWTEFRIG